MLKNIIVLSAGDIGNQVIDVLKQSNSNLKYEVVEYLADLEKYSYDFLAESRLISFISIVIVPKKILDALGYDGINFHPGPPTHPGWAPQRFAIYDEDETYGTTAHYMVEKVDAGKIIGIDYFAIDKNINVDELTHKSVESLTRLLNELAVQLTIEKKCISLPIPWGPNKTTKKMFEYYCKISKNITIKELTKRIRAFGGMANSPLYIDAKDGKYLIDNSKKLSAGVRYKYIHGIRFRHE